MKVGAITIMLATFILAMTIGLTVALPLEKSDKKVATADTIGKRMAQFKPFPLNIPYPVCSCQWCTLSGCKICECCQVDWVHCPFTPVERVLVKRRASAERMLASDVN